MHALLTTPLVGTRLPALVVDGRTADDPVVRARPVPAPAVRWTLLVLSPKDQPAVDEHRTILAAEAVTTVVAATSPATANDGAVLVDQQGVIQYVAGSIEEAVDAVRGLRTGAIRPVALRQSRPLSACPEQGRRRRGAIRMPRRAA